MTDTKSMVALGVTGAGGVFAAWAMKTISNQSAEIKELKHHLLLVIKEVEKIKNSKVLSTLKQNLGELNSVSRLMNHDINNVSSTLNLEKDKVSELTKAVEELQSILSTSNGVQIKTKIVANETTIDGKKYEDKITLKSPSPQIPAKPKKEKKKRRKPLEKPKGSKTRTKRVSLLKR